MRTPTEKQYRLLLTLGNGCMIISGLHGRTMRQCISHGWIAPEKPGRDNGFQITPDGLRALAVAVERYGLPPLVPQVSRAEPRTVQRLRESLDETRVERDELRRELRRAEMQLRQIRNAVEVAA